MACTSYCKQLLAITGILLAGLSVTISGSAQDMLSQFEENITEFTLDNGLTFVVLERHEAPVVSFYTYADVGGADEVKGITGIAHMFEHMAFKGTRTIGTKDLEKELGSMGAIDETYAQLKAERRKGAMADTARIAALEAEFEAGKEAAAEWVENGEFEKVIERAGGTGLNAGTSSDATLYFYSLPANKTELWFTLESDRFLNPVMREFYIERDVVMEERRMRTESNPVGRLLEEFLATAFKAHPYGEPVVGHMSDLQSFTREEAISFFQKYYGANNLTIAIAGSVDPNEIKRLAEAYFGRMPGGKEPDPVETVEPPQIAERRVIIEEESQPFLIVGYHKESSLHPDDAAFSVLSDVLSTGRTSRFYRRLVEEEKLALQVTAINNFPGDKYANLFLFFAVPTQGHTPEDLEEAIYDIVGDIQENGISEQELQRAKTRARASLIRGLQSNSGVAGSLAYYEAVTGDWRNLFGSIDRIDAVTVDQVTRIAQETFKAKNRTVAMIRTATSTEEEPDESGS